MFTLNTYFLLHF